MLKAMAGYGSDDRYESSFMLNHFKGNSRKHFRFVKQYQFVGFSMNEIFDNMGSSRSRSSGVRLGSGRGITQSYLGGISYSNDFGKILNSTPIIFIHKPIREIFLQSSRKFIAQ